jgi:hypothetical protein
MCLENYTEKNKVFKKTKLLGRVYRKKKKGWKSQKIGSDYRGRLEMRFSLIKGHLRKKDRKKKGKKRRRRH